jgi:hypothetical protein
MIRMVTGLTRRRAENSTRLSTASRDGGAVGSDFKAELEQQSALCISISEISKHAPDIGPIHDFPYQSHVPL